MSRIVVEGLDELRRDLRRADADLSKQLRQGLKGVADIVTEEAKSKAASVARTHPTGDMESKIRPKVRGTSAIIEAYAAHRGFNYPVRFEFGDYGRPFLEPAIESREGEIVEGFEEMVQDVLRRANLD